MMAEYKLTERFTQEVIDEILSLAKKDSLTPENIVEKAKDKESPLHNFFEWDDSEAGKKYRLQQARMIVNEIKVTIEEKEYYAFENVSTSVSNDYSKEGEQEIETIREYKPIIEILSNEELRKQVVASALNHLKYWEIHNAKYLELAPIIKSAERVRKKLNKQWQKKK